MEWRKSTSEQKTIGIIKCHTHTKDGKTELLATWMPGHDNPTANPNANPNAAARSGSSFHGKRREQLVNWILTAAKNMKAKTSLKLVSVRVVRDTTIDDGVFAGYGEIYSRIIRETVEPGSSSSRGRESEEQQTYFIRDEEWVDIIQGRKYGDLRKSPLVILLVLERLRLRKDEEAYFAVASRLVLFGQKDGWIDTHIFTTLCELRAEVLGKDGIFIPVTIPDTVPKAEDGDEDEEEVDCSCLLCSTDVSELPGEKCLFHYECGNRCTVLYCKPCLLEWILNRKETFDPHGWVGCNCTYYRTSSFRFLSRKL